MDTDKHGVNISKDSLVLSDNIKQVNTTSLNGFNIVHISCGRERGRKEREREREGRKEERGRERKDTCSMTIDYFMTYNRPLV